MKVKYDCNCEYLLHLWLKTSEVNSATPIKHEAWGLGKNPYGETTPKCKSCGYDNTDPIKTIKNEGLLSLFKSIMRDRWNWVEPK